MKDNKKYDVNDLYYATIIYDEHNKGYGIFKINKNVIDINTEAKYDIRSMCYNYILLEDNIKIKGITPFTEVLTSMYGKYSVNHILNADKHVSKEYSNKYNEYIFHDIYKPENVMIIMKNNDMKQITLFFEKIYSLGLTIENYGVNKHENEVLIMVINGLNCIEKLNKIREEKTFNNDIIYVSKFSKKYKTDIKNIFCPKQKQKRI